MKQLIFPAFEGGFPTMYYIRFGGYLRKWAEYAGIEVTLQEKSEKIWGGKGGGVYSCLYNGKQIVFEFSDFKRFCRDPKELDCPYFKFHYSFDYPQHIAAPNVFPFAPTMSFDWIEFKRFCSTFRYTADGATIINMQRPYGGAEKRRNQVQKMLKDAYGKDALTEVKMREEWLWLHKTALVAVNIPGARKDILDKGHIEQMGLGVCVICPEITNVLPWNKRLIPNEHYIPIKYDFSDLLDKVEWCKQHRGRCVDIGQNAKELFNQTMTPRKVWDWVDCCVGNYYKE